MYIIDVIPTVKIPKNTSQVLSYFSKTDLKAGALVLVPLGRTKINAMVVSSYNMDEDRLSIRKSGFQMKNVEKIISEEPIFSDVSLELFKWFLNFYASSLGLTAKTFIPSYLLKKTKPINLDAGFLSEKNSAVSRKKLIYGADRTEIYKKEIEKTLKEKKQVLFLVPDLYFLEYWQNEFKSFDPEILSSKLSPKKYFEAWQRIRNGGSKLIISTKAGVFSNFSDLGLIILDEEEDASYKSRDTMPYYQTKDVALKLAELFSANVIFGSVVPSVESYKNFEVARLNDIETKKPILVDMRNEVHGGNYSILSYQLQEKLENVINGGKKAVLFISRKGSETFVFCRDCGYVEKCPNCDASLIHHEGVKSFLACHYCGFKKDLILKCPKCQSHRIKYFGAGTQKSKEEILKLWPEAKVGILDSDFAPTQKEQKEVFDGFKNGNINILVGTQLLFKKYDLPKVDLAVVLSMDNLLYLPDFRSGERIFQVASRISFFCGKNSDFIIQTYTPENPIFEIIKNMDYEKFYKNEIQSRETFGYPPFSSLIKLIYKNKDRKIAELEADRLTSKIEKLNLKNIRILGPAPAYIPKVKNNYIWQVIVKIKNTDDPKKEKDLLLKNIPEGWIIDVNPESLL